MDNTLKNRLEQELDSVTTASDYGMLLTILSQKLGKPIDELREGKGRWTYKQWAEALRAQEYLETNPNSLFKEQLDKLL
jgi:hypothetical protein